MTYRKEDELEFFGLTNGLMGAKNEALHPLCDTIIGLIGSLLRYCEYMPVFPVIGRKNHFIYFKPRETSSWYTQNSEQTNNIYW